MRQFLVEPHRNAHVIVEGWKRRIDKGDPALDEKIVADVTGFLCLARGRAVPNAVDDVDRNIRIQAENDELGLVVIRGNRAGEHSE
jgi:hypothetical protein